MCGRVIIELETSIESAIELIFLCLENRFDFLPPRDKLRENLPHFLDEHFNESMKEWILRIKAKNPPKPNGTPEDVADNIVASAIAGFDSIRNRKAHRADMISDHSKRGIDLLL